MHQKQWADNYIKAHQAYAKDNTLEQPEGWNEWLWTLAWAIQRDQEIESQYLEELREKTQLLKKGK